MKRSLIICALVLLLTPLCNAQGSTQITAETQQPDVKSGITAQQPPVNGTLNKDEASKKLGGFTIAPAHPNIKSPSAIYLEVRPGDVKQDSVIIKNDNDHEIQLSLYPADSKKGSNGNYQPLTNLVPQNQIGWWIQLSQYDITLGPHESKEIGYTLRVPDSAAQNEYVGFICAVLQGDQHPGGLSYSVRYALGVRIKVTDNPQHIPLVGETNVFDSATPWFWGSLALFVAGIAILVIGTLRDRKKKQAVTDKP